MFNVKIISMPVPFKLKNPRTQFLEMERYAESFLDNGYEDLETVKQMGRVDLETVGVEDYHIDYLLTAVTLLQQKVK
jgi:hypothetical protein